MKRKIILPAAVVFLALLGVTALVWMMGFAREDRVKQAGETFLTLLFTASPEEQNDPQRFSPAYLEETYRPLVTDDLWKVGLANRSFALLVGQAAEEDVYKRQG